MTTNGAEARATETKRPVIEDPKERVLDVVRKMRVIANGLTEAQAAMLTDKVTFNVVAAAYLVCKLVRFGQVGLTGTLSPVEVAQHAGGLSKDDSPPGKAGVLKVIDAIEEIIGDLDGAKCEMLDEGISGVSPLRLAHAIIVGLRLGQLGKSGELSELEVAAYVAQLLSEGRI
jgi:hypothetical protein